MCIVLSCPDFKLALRNIYVLKLLKWPNRNVQLGPVGFYISLYFVRSLLHFFKTYFSGSRSLFLTVTKRFDLENLRFSLEPDHSSDLGFVSKHLAMLWMNECIPIDLN